MDLASADYRTLHTPFSQILDQRGSSEAFDWVTEALAVQAPGLRAQNALFIAFTGDQRGLSWLERHVATPVTDHWGTAAALLGVSWATLNVWCRAGGERRLMGLDALLAYRRPRPNMSPIHQIVAPVLPDRPAHDEFVAALEAAREQAASPRARKAIAAILECADEILEDRQRCVSVELLPSVFLRPDAVPSGATILEKQAEALGSVRLMLEDMVKGPAGK